MAALYDVIKQIVEKLPDSDDGDHLLQVLKGHLIIEQEFYKVIAADERRRRAWSYQLLSLAKAMKHDEVEPPWRGITKLNSIRTDYAHNLRPGQIQSSRAFTAPSRRLRREHELSLHIERGCNIILPDDKAIVVTQLAKVLAAASPTLENIGA